MTNFFRGLKRGWVFCMVVCITMIIVKLTQNYVFDTYTYELVQTTPNLPNFNQQDAYLVTDTKAPALIRLHRDREDGKDKFTCSGFVVSNQYAITAAHCLVNERQTLIRKEMRVHTLNDNELDSIAVKAVFVNITSDLGLIWGDFSQFAKLRIDTFPGAFFIAPGPFRTCGFPYGGSDLCTVFQPRGNYFNFIWGEGFLAPGMSGGPVLSLGENGVFAVGLNSSTMPNGVNVAPLISLFESAGVGVE